MSAEIPSSSSSPHPSFKSTAMCGQFLLVEFLIFFAVFLVGFASNVLFIMASYKKGNNSKYQSKNHNDYLVHCSIANLILMVRMPLDIISFTTDGSWFFGEFFCRYIRVLITFHTLNMIISIYFQRNLTKVLLFVHDEFFSM